MADDPLLETYLREIARTPLLSREEEVELARRVQRGDEKARERMIRANLRLVVKIAGDYRKCGLAMADLISEGNTGLMKAVERFDPDRGAKFSTYAAWWIKQSIRRALSNQGRTVRLPAHMIDKIRRLKTETQMIEEATGRKARAGELREAMGMNGRQLQLIRESSQKMASLDAPIGEVGNASLHERLPDDADHDPLSRLSEADLLGNIDELLAVLDERERHVVEARFGLDGKEPRTLEAIGIKFGVSRERIRQIQHIALNKMRGELRRLENPRPKSVTLQNPIITPM